MAATLEQVTAAFLALAFAWAAAAKLARWRDWRRALGGYRLGPAERPAAFGVPLVEGAAAALLVGGSTRAGAALCLALLSAFSWAVVRARAIQGDRLPCGCFGKTSQRDYRTMLVRNALLSAPAAGTLVVGDDVALLAEVSLPQAGQIAPAILVCVGIALAVWTGRRALTYLTEGENR